MHVKWNANCMAMRLGGQFNALILTLMCCMRESTNNPQWDESIARPAQTRPHTLVYDELSADLLYIYAEQHMQNVRSFFISMHFRFAVALLCEQWGCWRLPYFLLLFVTLYRALTCKHGKRVIRPPPLFLLTDEGPGVWGASCSFESPII